jgi:hypothetical protein
MQNITVQVRSTSETTLLRMPMRMNSSFALAPRAFLHLFALSLHLRFASSQLGLLLSPTGSFTTMLGKCCHLPGILLCPFSL